MYLKGCLCLDDIPEECISEYTNRKGETKRYLNFHIYKDMVKTQKIKADGRSVIYTHTMVAMPAKFGSGKVQIAMLEERTSPYDLKEQKEPKQKTKKETPSIDINTYEVDDEELF